MSNTQPTPFGAAVTGAIAGVVGTLAMDLVWYRRYRNSGGQDSFIDWEFSTNTEGYDDAAAPAKVGKRLIDGLFQTELAPDTAGVVNNAVHWATGMAWGTGHGIVAGSLPTPTPVLGALTGSVAWVSAYAALAPTGLYRPMWEYDPKTLWRDLSAHLVYGTVTAGVYALLTRIRPG